MATAKQLSKQYTLAEYLDCTDLAVDKNYELENGILREMPPESWQNLQIALYLILEIAKSIPRTQIVKGAEIIISGSRVNARIPDLMVLSPEGAAEIARFKRSTITLDMPPPILVVEVVSPGKANRDRDYRFKRSEYAARGIDNYWIIDPQKGKFVCLQLKDGLYEEKIYDASQVGITFETPFALEVNFSQLFDLL